MGREATITRIEIGATPTDKCSNHCVGNFNMPEGSVPDAIVGDEGFKYLFRPPIYQCACPDGFRIDIVHMLVEFEEDDFDGSSIMFGAYADLESPVWDEALSCWVPGTQECVTPTAYFLVNEPGIYDIAIPMGGACDCAFVDYWYFLGVFFEGSFAEGHRPNLVTDAYPLGCRSYHDQGGGWQDLAEEYQDWPGELVIWSEVECCDDPVGAETQSWSGVKSLYR
jgi:hypothetical protein